ncbi:helix-turn-helix domain-containing protein [Tenacibaculum ovolyticum]|uniref:helix-turn-helix domain-containing protein n=1 Tax=Tenacibaculum ovolyticum TaxID=104270 RepID=UPI0007EDC55C|nr:helix-turn-helix domain-containing protein [Tenacibaculum ovolyticum]
MSKEIPHLPFESKSSEIKGIEIITLENLESKKDIFDHLPERAHQLEFYQLAFYTNGKTEHLVDFVWHTVESNAIIYVSKGQVNAFKFNKGVKGYLLLFTEEYFKNQLANIPQNTAIRLLTPQLFSPKVKVPEASNILTYIQLVFNEFYKVSENFNKKHIIDSLFNIIFSKLEEIKKNQTGYIKESEKFKLFLSFQTFLKNDFVLNKNADYYANKLNITYKHLNVVCKEIINKTAKQYIDEFVILEAKRNLINSSIKSTELAYLMGFEESTNFVKYFKKHTGFTPNTFKNNNI